MFVDKVRISAAYWVYLETEVPTNVVESSLIAYVGIEDGSIAFYGVKSLEGKYCVMRA